MPYQNLSVQLTPQELADIIAALDVIDAFLQGKVINLSMEERQSLYKMRNTRYNFAVRTMNLAASYPEFIPSFANYPDAQRDFAYYQQLSVVTQRTNRLAEKIDDTLMAAGSELLKFCLVYYNNVKMALSANVPGADSVFNELNPFFDLPPRPQDDTDTPTE